MIKEIKSPYKNTLIYELDTFISKVEIDIMEKGIQETLKHFDKVNLMINVNVAGESLGAFIKEFQMGIKYLNKINKIAYVTDKKHWETLVAIDNIFTKIKEKYFGLDDIAKAWDWINN